jgi:two-component system OmpR family response regulator
MDQEQKKRVFIVDDEPGFTRLVKLTLERTGKYIVREENDGEKAWLAIREWRPDIVFLDVVMPKIDGGEVAQQIRSDPLLARIPIVFLTAIVSQRESTHHFGGFPFLAKPVSIEAISNCIEEHLKP